MPSSKEIVEKYRGSKVSASQIVAKYKGGVKKTSPRIAPKVDPKIISEGEKANQFLNRSLAGQIFSRQFAKEVPKATAQTVIGNPVKFALSVKEIPEIVKKKQFTNKEYSIPGLGKTTSFQTDYGKVANEVIAGKKGLGSAAFSLAQIPLAGMETAGVIGSVGKFAKGVQNANALSKAGMNVPSRITSPTPSTKGIISKGVQSPQLPPQRNQVDQNLLSKIQQEIPATGKRRVTESIKSSQKKPLKEFSLEKVNPSYNTSSTPGVKSRGFVDTVKQSQMTDPEVVKAVSSTYTPRETEQLVSRVNDLIKKDINKAKDVALGGTNDESVATAMELIKHYQNKGDFDSAVQIAEDIAPKLTEAGRTVQAASIYNRLTPEGIVRYAVREVNKYNKANPNKSIKLTGEQAKELSELSKRASSLEGEERTIATQQMLDKVQELLPSSKIQQAITVWKAGLLTNPSTHIANLTGNSAMLGLENLKDIPATGMDILASLFTGKRTKALPSIGAQAQGFGEGIVKGARFARTGIDPENVLAKVDYQKVNLPPILKQYTDVVFRSLGTGDKVFRQTFFKKTLAELAKVDGMNKGLSGQQLMNHIDEVFQNPPVQIVEQATKDALYGTFNSRNALSDFIGNGKRSLGNFRGVADFIMPFTQTPTNVAARIADYSPLGFGKAAYQGATGGGQRAVVESLGRALTGTGIAGLGYGMAEDGNLTGTAPTNETEKNLWELQGKQANSVKVGDKYYSLEKLSPLGNILGMGANYQQSGNASETAFQTIKGLKDMTFLKGMSSALDALNDPERYGKSYIENTASSAIPSVVSALARQVDPTKRETNGAVEAVMNRIPGLKDNLLPKRDALGNETYYEGNQLFSPVRQSGAKTNIVANEIERLRDMGGDVTLSKPGKNISLVGGAKVELTPEEYNKFLQSSGGLAQKLLEKIIVTNEYQNANPVEQANMIAKIIQKTREATKYQSLGSDRTMEGIKTYLQEKQSKPFYQN